MVFLLPLRPVVVTAVQQLSTVDYTVANKVTADVAVAVDWAYAHNLPRLAGASVHLLQTFDDIGSVLIALVVWLVNHTA